jgi:replication initiation protein RepC
MTYFSPSNPIANRFLGARVASEALRHSQAEEFLGLEEDANRYELLLLVKRAGKLAGFTPRMVELLDYYLAYTREEDWLAGARPIVFQGVTRTAMDLGVSERQIQKLERALFQAGALTWNDSGNHRRYGHRCPETGRIVYAFGVDLSPLARLRDKLQALLDEKRRHDEAWRDAKREVSSLRAQTRGLLAEWGSRPDADLGALADFASHYEAIATPIRSHVTLAALRTLVEAHLGLVERLRDAMGASSGQRAEPLPCPSIPQETP